MEPYIEVPTTGWRCRDWWVRSASIPHVGIDRGPRSPLSEGVFLHNKIMFVHIYGGIVKDNYGHERGTRPRWYYGMLARLVGGLVHRLPRRRRDG